MSDMNSKNDNNTIDELLESLDSLGIEEQEEAGESLEALKRPVQEMMQDQSNQLPAQLLQLKETVSQLEPSHLEESAARKWINKLLRRNPMEQYAQKYKTVEEQVENIVSSLLSGKDKLQEDTLMLQELKKVATERINNLNNQIEYGNKLNAMLEEEMKTEEWKDNPAEIKDGQRKVITRIKNMSQAVMVLQQSLASVDLIVDNNNKLEEAIFNAITMTKNVITVSASIQLALSNQQKVISAVTNVNEATESMLLSNAELLKHNTEQTLKTLEEPAIAIETFKKAYNNVFEAIELTEASNERIVQSGKDFIAELDHLNKEMKTKLLN